MHPRRSATCVIERTFAPCYGAIAAEGPGCARTPAPPLARTTATRRSHDPATHCARGRGRRCCAGRPRRACPRRWAAHRQADNIDPIVRMAERAHARALARNVRLHRVNARAARRRRRRPPPRQARATGSIEPPAHASSARLRKRNAPLRRQAPATPPHLAGDRRLRVGRRPDGGRPLGHLPRQVPVRPADVGLGRRHRRPGRGPGGRAGPPRGDALRARRRVALAGLRPVTVRG